MSTAVRQCMECRFERVDTSKAAASPPATTNTTAAKGPFRDPIETLLDLTYLFNTSSEANSAEDNLENLLLSFIKNSESVLQDVDIQRLRAILYRDVVRQDRSKTGKNVVIVVVNLFFALFLFSLALCVCILFCMSLLSMFKKQTNKHNDLIVNLSHRMIRNNRNFWHCQLFILHRF